MELRAAKGELALALIFAATGGVWIARAAGMPLWEGFAPHSGFLPLIYGILLAGLALSVIAGLLIRGSANVHEEIRKPLLVLAALTAAVAGLEFVGFLAAIFLMLMFLYAVIERLPVLIATLVSAAMTGALHLVFKTWLGVPLP